MSPVIKKAMLINDELYNAFLLSAPEIFNDPIEGISDEDAQKSDAHWDLYRSQLLSRLAQIGLTLKEFDDACDKAAKEWYEKRGDYIEVRP